MRIITIKKCDGEYRVPAPDNREEGAYYTDCKDDAKATATNYLYKGLDVVIKFRTVSEDWA